MVPQKENGFSTANLRDMEHCDLTCKDFKIALRNKLKENSGSQFNERMTKVLDLKNSKDMKNAL